MILHRYVQTMAIVGVLCGLAFTLGCGSETAQPTDVIVAPADMSVTIDERPTTFAGGPKTSVPLVFLVQDPNNKSAPVPGVVVELFTSSASAVAPCPAPCTGPRLTDESANCLNPLQCERYKVKTDNQGKVAIYFTDNPPSQSAAADITVNREVTAFITASRAVLKIVFTIKKI